VSPVKYELGFYIPEDDILHSHRCEDHKSYSEFCSSTYCVCTIYQNGGVLLSVWYRRYLRTVRLFSLVPVMPLFTRIPQTCLQSVHQVELQDDGLTRDSIYNGNKPTGKAFLILVLTLAKSLIIN
jgi:hypothetical protein